MDTTGLIEWQAGTAQRWLDEAPQKCPVNGAPLWNRSDEWVIPFAAGDKRVGHAFEIVCGGCFWWAQEHLPMRKVG